MGDRALLEVIFQRAARPEAGHAAGRDADGLAGTRVAPVALSAAADQEGAEAADGHLPTATERVEHVVEQRVQRLLRGGLRGAGRLGDGGHEIGLGHGAPTYAPAAADSPCLLYTS